jgi:hypothetical protein
MRPQTRRTDVLLITALANVRPVVGVQSLVQLQMDKLSELLRAQVTLVGFLSAVESQVSLQVRCRRESLLADVALVRFLSGVHEMMLL